MARALNKLLRPRSQATDRIFPSIDTELGPYKHLFRGRVLNAGAGDRDLSHLVNGELVNLEVPREDGGHSDNIHVWAPLDQIPVADGHFNAIICNAVLEHVLDPERVMAELARVLSPGGTLYLGVPFLQPEHLDPTDSQRYLAQGLRALCERHELDVTEITPVHSVDTTLAWILHEWLQAEHRPGRLVFGRLAYEYLSRAARGSKVQVHAVASAYRAVCIRR